MQGARGHGAASRRATGVVANERLASGDRSEEESLILQNVSLTDDVRLLLVRGCRERAFGSCFTSKQACCEPSHSRGAPEVPEPLTVVAQHFTDTKLGRNLFVPPDRHLYALVLKRIPGIRLKFSS